MLHLHEAKPLTFSQAVADAGIPGQQCVPVVEPKDQHVRQAKDGEGVGHAIVSEPWLHATDALKKQSKPKVEFAFYYWYAP